MPYEVYKLEYDKRSTNVIFSSSFPKYFYTGSKTRLNFKIKCSESLKMFKYVVNRSILKILQESIMKCIEKNCFLL